MRKILALLLVFTVMISFTACGKAKAGDSGASQENVKVSDNEESIEKEKDTNAAVDNIVEVEETVGVDQYERFPNILLSRIDGTEAQLYDYEDKIILINMWALSCVYCLKELPDFQILEENNDDVKVLTVSVSDMPSAIKKYFDKNGLSLEAFVDAEGKISRAYKVGGIPHTIVIDKDKSFLGNLVGYNDLEELEELVEKIRNGELSQGN